MRHRTIMLVVALAAAPALASDLPSGAGRFVIGPSKDGFVRLDTATGAASHCAVKDGAWSCEPLPENDSALQARVDALTTQVARLTAAVAALDDRVAQLAAGPAPAEATAPSPPDAAPAEPGFARVVVNRFLDLVRRLKHGDESA